MVGLLEKQMKKEKIIKIVFVAYKPKKTGGWLPCFKALKIACGIGKVN